MKGLPGLPFTIDNKQAVHSTIDAAEHLLKRQLEALANLRQEIVAKEEVGDVEREDVRSLVIVSTIGTFDVVKHVLIQRLFTRG